MYIYQIYEFSIENDGEGCLAVGIEQGREMILSREHENLRVRE